MTLFITGAVGLPGVWAGIALGLAAVLEVPALMMMGRLGARFSSLALVATGCIAGVVYFIAVRFVTEPVLLLALQPLNAWRVAAIAGMGIALFQQMIRQPGLSTGLFLNSQRVGSVLAGPVIVLGAATILKERGIFVVCAVLSATALVIILAARRRRAR
ncbi:hypothetical protein ACH3VR_09140 [Microbacterium sp. B2969]|uniref:Major facilitator superfamily (MFS) profile domain-containing protein n=1 Tax=Microbacterium alkaliflavum TaxID=3248839 RepID=A0ABW7Q8N3_9MICO